jgi:DNA-binding NarL/FixJ family response regulator
MNAPAKIRVLTVDDHPLLREGIKAIIDQAPDMEMVAQAANGREAIQQFRKVRPDVTLMDVQMPELDGIEALIAIRNEFPDARVIVLTTYQGDVQAMRALKAGAHAFLLKSLLQQDMLDTIRDVHAGHKRIGPEIAEQLADHFNDEALTPREVDVLRLIAQGNSNKEIADRLSMSQDTVKGHVKNILNKLGANDRTHAVTIGLKRGILVV